DTLYVTGDDEGQLNSVAWYSGNNPSGCPRPVASLKPNPFGLYDMHGNTWEWCADAFDEKFYRCSPAVDPVNPAAGGSVVCRSGSWYGSATYARSAYRSLHNPGGTYYDIGFRIFAE
ncbi:MAG: formylglycine-generating enzyme family protein, partial [Planctomyces sp.]